MAFQLFCKISQISTWTVPIGLAFTSILFPCKSPLLGSIFFSGTKYCDLHWYSFPDAFPLWTIGLITFIIVMQFYTGAVYYAVYVLLIGTTHLVIECRGLKRIGKNNILLYRKIQIWEKVLNFCTSQRIFPTIVFSVSGLQIISAFALAILRNNSGVGNLAVFFLMYLNSFVFNMIMFSFAAKIYSVSKKWLKMGEKNVKGGYMRRLHRSYRPLRMSFFNNFIDELTPLVMQDFSLTQTISLLLLSSEQ